ncbi:sensor histidine kinase [Streptodolium elevatio]|uniref:histidine kinase n=1 Tax=Streptodolium elevatio TaxID=3157996 RepID=A0ABV3DL06_9ACTN
MLRSSAVPLAVLVIAGPLVLGAGFAVWASRGRRHLGTATERATFETLHHASQAAPLLRAGLTADSARRSARHLRALLGVPALALCRSDGEVLAWEGPTTGGDHGHAAAVRAGSERTSRPGRVTVLGPDQVECGVSECPLQHAVVVPLVVSDRVEGVFAVFAPHASTGLVRAAGEVGRWISTQLELAELDRSRAALADAEVRALRAQISPHFIYNSLTAIASFVRTDPERARELIVEFAEFTRYSFRQHGSFTSLAEELRCVDRYLLLERARFGDRLSVSLRIAPEVLPVVVPFLCLQPLVENAVRHGLERSPGPGHLVITAEDKGTEAWICVEDDGVGMEPAALAAVLAGGPPPTRPGSAGAELSAGPSRGEPPVRGGGSGAGIGLRNVDERLRQVYGDVYGIVVETAPGAGTKVRVRIPKFHPSANDPR